jgi:hypothetical protein
MKKSIFTLVLLIIFSTFSHAQFWKIRRWECGGGLGTTNLYGDLGGYSKGKNLLGIKDFSLSNTRFNLNLNGKYRILNNFSGRVDFTYGRLHSTDAKGVNIERGFESSTNILEFSMLAEFYFIKNKAENSFLSQKGKMPFRSMLSLIDCYSFTGFGITSFNVTPNAAMMAQASTLKDTAPVIPLGVGVSFNFSPELNFNAEASFRYALSDYLDGYTSVYSKSNDVYALFHVGVIYKIKLAKMPGF